MQVKYELTPEDLTLYSREGVKGTNVYTVMAIMWVVIIVLFMMSDMLMSVLAAFFNDGSIRVDAMNVLPRMIVGLALAGISCFVLMRVSKQAYRKFAATPGKNGVFCEHTIELDEVGFTETTHVNRGFQSWDGVEKITETKSFVVLQVRAGAGYLIPKRAFSSPEEINQFISIAQGYLNSAYSPHNPPPPPSFRPSEVDNAFSSVVLPVPKGDK